MQATPDKLMHDLLKATAGQTGERIEKIRARAQESVRNARERLQGRVQDNPWAAIGIAAGVGLLAGVLLARK